MQKLTYDVREAAQPLGISAPKMYDLARSKGFPSIFIGRRIVIPVDKFMQWMERQTGTVKIR